jgi:hypothetical protein
MLKFRVRIYLWLLWCLFVGPPPAFALRCDANEPALGRWELIQILRQGGFSNGIDEYMELKRLGNIKTGEKCFTLFVYTRESQSAPATNLHYTARLLVIREYEYLGMYSMDTLPTGIRQNTVEFPIPEKWGNRIVFDKNGPPQKIHLDGEFRELFK